MEIVVLHTIVHQVLLTFDLCQPADQGGFKRSHQTVDHLMVNRMLEQRCREWCILMFISTIDFRKAFDRVKHQSLWNALKHFGIDLKYIDFLKKINIDQKATVLTDKESDDFEIKRGTKQGDPLSSLHFNAVLQYALEDDLKKWQRTQQRFCRRCIAFFSTSLSKLKDRLSDFKRKYRECGFGDSIQTKQKISVTKM